MRYANREVDIVCEGLPLTVELDFDDDGVHLNDIQATATGDCVVGMFTEAGQELIKQAASDFLLQQENERWAA